MRIAIAGMIIAVAIAAALWLSLRAGHDTKRPPPDNADAAVLVAKCDAAMSTLDAAMGSASPADAVASRLTVCTKAKAAIERARATKPSAQLDVAAERVAKHLQRLADASPPGSAGSAP